MSNWAKYLQYEEATGKLFWKDRSGEVSPNGRVGKWTSQYYGKEAGHKASSGYLMVGVQGKLLSAHRVIWEMMVGPIPPRTIIDHINGNPLDNRLCNLRLASHGENKTNSKSSAASGLKGVYPERGKFRAQLRTKGKCISIGTFPTKGLAAVAYAKMSLQIQGKFSLFYRKAALHAHIS